MGIFDPQLMNIILATPGEVNKWRRRLRGHLLSIRPRICDCCGEKFKGAVDVHEGIVSRSQVKGWQPKWKRALIFSEFNCILICPQCHQNPPIRQMVWDLQVGRYGEIALRRFYESLPWKVPPQRFWSS